MVIIRFALVVVQLLKPGIHRASSTPRATTARASGTSQNAPLNSTATPTSSPRQIQVPNEAPRLPPNGMYR